jgi:hypothetical protein
MLAAPFPRMRALGPSAARTRFGRQQASTPRLNWRTLRLECERVEVGSDDHSCRDQTTYAVARFRPSRSYTNLGSAPKVGGAYRIADPTQARRRLRVRVPSG